MGRYYFSIKVSFQVASVFSELLVKNGARLSIQKEFMKVNRGKNFGIVDSFGLSIIFRRADHIT